MSEERSGLEKPRVRGVDVANGSLHVFTEACAFGGWVFGGEGGDGGEQGGDQLEGHGLLFLFVGRRLHVDGGWFCGGGGGGDGGGGGGFLAGSSFEQAVESSVDGFTPCLLGVGRVDGELLLLEMKGCDLPLEMDRVQVLTALSAR